MVAQPQLDYAGLSRVLVSATSYMVKETREESHALWMRAATTCGHCGKTGHSTAECWALHPEKKPPKCFICQEPGHRAAECPTKTTDAHPLPPPPIDAIATVLASAHTTEKENTQTTILLDTACPVHLINNPDLLLNTLT